MKAVEIAIKMETDAINFYKEAAARTSSPVGEKMFLSVAEDEKRHLLMLSKIFKGEEIIIEDVNPKDNIRTIFEAMKDEMMQRIKATDDELEAFKIAMQMEKDGIEFYKKAELEAKSQIEKKLFKRLIEEERHHYDIFAETYSFLLDTGNWFMWDEHSIVEG
ncbi:MAG: ferritin family protein [Nitrospirae bacterium]|nr:ferritin family protein [Nitrospirota bacterium]